MNTKAPSQIDVFVGSRVRMRRLMAGLSQEKLADGLGITFQQVQKYEKGTNRIGASRLHAIADILGVHPSFFFQEGEDPAGARNGAGDTTREPSEISSFVSSKEGIALNRAFLKITDPVLRKKIISLVAAVAQTPETETARSTTSHAQDLHG
ncbi:helix-turn-helix domain-containing protein [Ensifer adhaerens]|uniref:helix-turn-helix domain-containing protein n=1 Tax=Ensifer adhaerens TaxID=106592 RepID=UPI00098F0F1F|nr:helix-turn-helix transcriptional regulator [Ensifer adhaerens]